MKIINNGEVHCISPCDIYTVKEQNKSYIVYDYKGKTNTIMALQEEVTLKHMLKLIKFMPILDLDVQRGQIPYCGLNDLRKANKRILDICIQKGDKICN